MPLRVIQWATGYVGTSTLREVIRNPDLELAGVFVYTPEKEGVDAGELAGLGPIGVKATGSREEILELEADVVLHCPLAVGGTALDKDVLALLESGKNVISAVSYAYPKTQGEDYARQFEEACTAGGVSLMCGGIDPDFALSWLPAALTRMCTDVEHVYVAECSDLTKDPHHTMMIELFQIGRPVESLSLASSEIALFLMGLSEQAVALLASNLGVTLDDDIGLDYEVHQATRDLQIPIGEVPEGTVCGLRMTRTATWRGKEFIKLDWMATVQPDHPKWPNTNADTRFVIEIEGAPSVNTTVDLMESDLTAGVHGGFYGTAACLVRAIPDICAAQPGIFTMPVPGAWAPASNP